MTVAVSLVNQELLLTLQQTTQHIPFHEFSRLVYNAHVPGRYDKIHTGRWREHEVEIREPFGEPATVEKTIRLLQRLSLCPQILHLYGYTIEPKTSIPHLVFQHNEHGTLHSYLRNFHAHLTWSDRFNLAMDIALGLRYLHHKGCRHRHLHSASILVDSNGSAVLSDFGIGRDSEVISSREHITRMAYLAPERLTKNGMRYAVECDIYSLGVIFWEISSGRPPFQDLITPQNIQSGALASLAQSIVLGRRERAVPGTDAIFEDLYSRCWHPNPEERPPIEWIIQTLGVLLKQPTSAILRQIEELSIDDEPKIAAYSNRNPNVDTSRNTMMTIHIGRGLSMELDRDWMSPISPTSPIDSRDGRLPLKNSDCPPPPPAVPPPIPPISHRRKISAAATFDSVRSMSVSSNSSNGSSSSAGPTIPARDARRVSTMPLPMNHSGEPPVAPKRRSKRTIWSACQEGNAEVAEWCIRTVGAGPNDLAYLPAYSTVAKVAPIHFACFYLPEKFLEVLLALERNGATMNLTTTEFKQTALHILMEFATNYSLALEAARYLILECKLSVNDPDYRGVTPFHKYIKNPHLSDIVSVAGSEMYTLLRDRGEANLTMESHSEGNALGVTARYLRVDLMKLFLVTDISCSEPKSLAYASSAVELPLADHRSSKTAQEQCRVILSEWKGQKGEKKRMKMAERIVEHRGMSVADLTSLSSGFLTSPIKTPLPLFPGTMSKPKKQGGLLGLVRSNKSSKEELPQPEPPLSARAAREVEAAKAVLAAAVAKQQKLMEVIAVSIY
ncbi:hypothetical protein BGZ51_006368 [Haplosporangium sp. Z 767]|nr:hypothetical protein BGZ50_001106 [Haplosporangium sp. Z 11]KAF9192010.1 hypothetical protein BGZ51_006368 [Haplosporangium sp. Z 767]